MKQGGPFYKSEVKSKRVLLKHMQRQSLELEALNHRSAAIIIMIKKTLAIYEYDYESDEYSRVPTTCKI